MHTDQLIQIRNTDDMTVHEFIAHLKSTKAFTMKQSVVIDNVFIYFEDLKVYKAILQINPSMMKKAKRLGIDSGYITYYFDGPTSTKLRFDEDTKHELTKGRFIAIYDIHKITCSVYHGEESEDAQLKRL